MIFQRLSKKRDYQGDHVKLTHNIKALQNHDWSDNLLDEWCASLDEFILADVAMAKEKKAEYCTLAQKICA